MLGGEYAEMTEHLGYEKRCIAIEWESEYLPLIVERLTKPRTIGFDFEYGI